VDRDFPPLQTVPGAHPASCTMGMGTGSFPGVKYGRGVLLTTHQLLVPRSWKSRAIPLHTLWATTGPVTGTLCLFSFCINGRHVLVFLRNILASQNIASSNFLQYSFLDKLTSDMQHFPASIIRLVSVKKANMAETRRRS
jgi:hypothetical protein